MTNVYLEKIASMKEIEPGLFSGKHGEYYVTPKTRDELIEEYQGKHFKSQQKLGAKVMGSMGAVLGGVVGTSPAFGNGFKARALSSLVGAAVGGGLGAISGVGLARGGNDQTREYDRKNMSSVKRHIRLYHGDHKSAYWDPTVHVKQDS